MNDKFPQASIEHYEIRVKGNLDPRWSRWFEGMTLTLLPGGETLLAGPVADQAALQGIIARIGDLGLKLLLVRQVDTVDPDRSDK